MCDSKYPFEVVLCWAVSAKNTLSSVNGYSPNQLVFGKNPNMPSVLVNKPPALEGVSTSEYVANTLNLIHANKKAYIECESSDKLRRAFRHQIRPSLVQIYNNGDRVYFKRNESQVWMGPGTVIGWEAKQVLVKHGSSYVRVHPCRLMHCSANVEKTFTDDEVQGQVECMKHNGNNNSQTQQLAEVEDLSEEDLVEGLGQDDVPGSPISQDRNKEKPPGAEKQSLKVSDLPKPGQIIDYKMSNGEVLEDLRGVLILRGILF